MGYYTKITQADFTIPADKLEAAYAAVCELNDHNDLKYGGSYPCLDLPADYVGPRKDKWFIWMDWNYPETCKDLEAVLEALGFEVGADGGGGLCIDAYDNKSGDEVAFIQALAPYAPEGSYINWEGEDGHMYRHQVKDGKVVTLEAKEVVWGRPQQTGA